MNIRFLLAIIPSLTIAVAFTMVPTRALAVTSAMEAQARGVDQVALSSQDNAIKKLKGFLASAKGSPREGELLLRLAELEQEKAALIFRIAHGKASSKKPDLGPYKKAMRDSVRTLSRVIEKFPNLPAPSRARAFFLRAKAHEEVEQKNLARSDYQSLISKYPTAPEALPSQMALARFATDQSLYLTSIEHLSAVEKAGEGPFYPFALYQLAWANYHLGKLNEAISYVEKHAQYYGSEASESDAAFQEKMLLDSATFFLAGFEQSPENFPPERTLSRFEDIAPKAILGRVAHRYARLLRSHKHSKPLTEWKDLVLKRLPTSRESWAIAFTTFEYQEQEHLDPLIAKTAMDLKTLAATPELDPKLDSELRELRTKTSNLLLKSAERLHKKIRVTKSDEKKTGELTETFLSVYEAFAALSHSQDERIPKLRYNLAEALFAVGRYREATAHYQAAVDDENSTRSFRWDARRKRLASRYEELRQARLIPEELKPLDLGPENDEMTDEEGIPPLLSEWIGWIDEFRDDAPASLKDQAFENLIFEANRAIYAQGQPHRAMKRLRDFAAVHPGSKFGAASATLAMDTLIVSHQWEALRDFSSQLQHAGKQHRPNRKFRKLLASRQAEAQLKLAEEAIEREHFGDALDYAEEYLEDAQSDSEDLKLHAKVLLLASHAAEKSDEPETALKHLSALLSPTFAKHADSKQLAHAAMQRAALHERAYRIPEAAEDLLRIRKIPDDLEVEPRALKEKTLAFAWMSQNPKLFKKARSQTCGRNSPKLADLCSSFEALSLIQEGKIRPDKIDDAIAATHRGTQATQSAWAAASLLSHKKLSFEDRMRMLRELSKGWEKLDAVSRWALLSFALKLIPEAMEYNREILPRLAPIDRGEESLARRVAAMEKMEDLATDLIDTFAFAKLRQQLLKTTAFLYKDFGEKLLALSHEPEIREIAEPFIEKANVILAKADEIQLTSERDQKYWLSRANRAGSHPLIRAWRSALQSRHWARAGYLLTLAEEMDEDFSESTLSRMRASSLGLAGADTEAERELDQPDASNPPAALASAEIRK